MNPYYSPERLENSRTPQDFESLRKQIVNRSEKLIHQATERSNNATIISTVDYYKPKAVEQTQEPTKPEIIGATPYMIAKQQLEGVYDGVIQPEIQNIPDNVIQMPLRSAEAQADSVYPVSPKGVVPMPSRQAQQQSGKDLPLPYNGEYKSA